MYRSGRHRESRGQDTDCDCVCVGMISGVNVNEVVNNSSAEDELHRTEESFQDSGWHRTQDRRAFQG